MVSRSRYSAGRAAWMTSRMIRSRISALPRRVGVLGGDHHRVDPGHLLAVELHGDLGFAVGPQPGDLAVLAHFGQLAGQGVGEVQGGGHELRGLGGGVAEHQALVAGAAGVHAHGDVRALLVQGHHHRAGVAVKALGAMVIADAAHRLPGQLGHRDVAVGGDLPGHDDQPGGHQGFAGHPAVGVAGEGARPARRPRSGRRSCRDALRSRFQK